MVLRRKHLGTLNDFVELEKPAENHFVQKEKASTNVPDGLFRYEEN